MEGIYISTQQGYIRGFVDDALPSPEGYLEMIRVFNGLERRGFGTQLLQKFERQCLLNHARNISGWITPSNIPIARAFFLRNNYEIISVGYDLEIYKEI